MFNFMGMMGNYEDRKVARFEEGELIVDTCSITDGEYMYETGVRHPYYDNGNWIIVEAYATHKEAEEGHLKWVTIMTTEPLPETLSDCYNSYISQLSKALGNNYTFTKEIRKE